MSPDPLAAARNRGEEMYRALLDGCVDEVAMGLLMGIIPASVKLRRQSDRIVAIPVPVDIPHTQHCRVEWRYPVWQLVYNPTSGFYQPAPGLVEVWISLGSRDTAPPVLLVRFLLSENTLLGNRRPMDLLRERYKEGVVGVGDIMDAARQFDEQGST